jgi:CheY-like chemotaxis protein
MCRILVVDDDPHICLAIWAWLKRYDFRVSIADGGVNGLAALRERHLRFDDRRYLHAQHARIDQEVSRACCDGAVDCCFRIRLLGIGCGKSRLSENRRQARRDAMPSQAVQADDMARCKSTSAGPRPSRIENMLPR